MREGVSSGGFPPQESPFHPDADAAYRRWRDAKLEDYPARVDDLIVTVRDPARLSDAEHAEIVQRCRKANMAAYATAPYAELSKDGMRALGRRCGLEQLDSNMLADDDGITPLAVATDAGPELRAKYIPYTDRPISWHTDGYYNTPEHTVRGLMLYCVRPAVAGGFNDLLDHEIAYILLRDESVDHVAALMRPDAMTIPANDEDGYPARADSTGPVFWVDPSSGALIMRYTFRVRSIRWSADPGVQAASKRLREILNAGGTYFFRHRLEPGQGLVCNNVLHTRTEFTESPSQPRLLYRARYFDRVSGT